MNVKSVSGVRDFRSQPKARASGRVGSNLGGSRPVPNVTSGTEMSDDILIIYKRLLDLQEQRESDLTSAILYGLKLLLDEGREGKH